MPEQKQPLDASQLVLLVGASVAFYLQHPEYLYAKPGEPRLSNRMRERLGVAVMHLIGSHFVRRLPPWTLHRLTERLAVPMYAVNVVLDALARGGLLWESNEGPPAYLPARDRRGRRRPRRTRNRRHGREHQRKVDGRPTGCNGWPR